MKLHIVPAKQGLFWAKSGIRTFMRQPLALSGLFFMYLAVGSLISVIPVLGKTLALALLPAATLGLMAATREADDGKFPMPLVLLSAFRAGRQRLQAMLVLGGLYALGVALVMGFSVLIDGGKCARIFLIGEPMTIEMLQEGDFQLAVLVVSTLCLPLSLLFWHAPALVHWHGIPPVKSLFFSLVACMRNMGAFMVYGLVWMGVFLIFWIFMAMLSTVVGSIEATVAMLYPAVMLMFAMFSTSIYYSFLDSFEFTPGEDA